MESRTTRTKDEQITTDDAWIGAKWRTFVATHNRRGSLTRSMKYNSSKILLSYETTRLQVEKEPGRFPHHTHWKWETF